MHPVLFQLGSLTIHSYGMLIALGFFLALGVAKWLGKKSGLDTGRLIDLGFWVLFIGFAASRVLFIFTRLDYFMSNPMAMFRFWEGGFVFFGGLIGAFGFASWYVRHYKIPYWKAADVAFPALALGHAFGRLGCFMAGCCHGRATDVPWAMRFDSTLVDIHLRGVPIHPTQLYESFSLLILFVGLLWVYHRRVFDGQVALTYLMAYPIIRSVIEVYRGDGIRGFVIQDVLSTSQFISILVFAAAAVALFYRLRVVSRSEKSQRG